MVLPTADVLGKEAAAHSRLLGRCVQGQPNNRSKLFGDHLFFFLVKDIGNLISLSWRPLFTLMTTSSTLPNIYDKNPQNSFWHSFTHPSIHGNHDSWKIYHFQRCTYHLSCYDKEGGIKSCVGCKIYFCFLCHDNMTGLLSTLYITKMTSPSSDYQYGKIWTCERYQHDQTSNRYGKIIKVGKIWAWGGSHGVIY